MQGRHILVRVPHLGHKQSWLDESTLHLVHKGDDINIMLRASCATRVHASFSNVLSLLYAGMVLLCVVRGASPSGKYGVPSRVMQARLNGRHAAKNLQPPAPQNIVLQHLV